MVKLTLAEMDRTGKDNDFFQRYDYLTCSGHAFTLTCISGKWMGSFTSPTIDYDRPVMGNSAQEVLDIILNNINSGKLEEFTKDLNIIKSID